MRFLEPSKAKAAVKKAMESGKFVIPYDCLCKTTKEQKQEVIKELDPKEGPRGTMFRDNRIFKQSIGGIGMVRADILTDSRFDERFIGWGSEDVAFFKTMSKRAGVHRLEGPLFHLWHPIADKTSLKKNQSLVLDYYSNEHIPRVANFVWVGGPMPDHLNKNIERFGRIHPNWQVKIWGNDDLHLFECQEAIQSQRTYAGVADIMRVEAVYKNGGVYLDTDMVCLRPIDPVINGVKAFVVRETNDYLGNAVFGSMPEHKLLKPILDCFKNMSFPLTGPQNKKTGPHLFTKLANTSGKTRELQPKSFFPVPFSNRKEVNSGIVDLDDPEIYAIHQWSHSWKDQ